MSFSYVDFMSNRFRTQKLQIKIYPVQHTLFFL